MSGLQGAMARAYEAWLQWQLSERGATPDAPLGELPLETAADVARGANLALSTAAVSSGTSPLSEGRKGLFGRADHSSSLPPFSADQLPSESGQEVLVFLGGKENPALPLSRRPQPARSKPKGE